MKNTVIELLVNNHPGVMYQISGLFARRAFNLEGILCGAIGDGSMSRIYLLVNREQNMEQMQKQLEKLFDVTSVTIRENIDKKMASRFYDFF